MQLKIQLDFLRMMQKKNSRRCLWRMLKLEIRRRKKKNKNVEKTYCEVRNVVEKVIKCETDNVNVAATSGCV